MIKSDFGIKALKLHKKLKGKIEISLKAPIVSLEDLKFFILPASELWLRILPNIQRILAK